MAHPILQTLQRLQTLALENPAMQTELETVVQKISQLQRSHSKLQKDFLHVKGKLDLLENGKQKSLSYLQHLLTHIEEGVLWIDWEGVIQLSNPAAHQVLGRSVSPPQKFWHLFPDDFLGFPMREALAFGISHQRLYHTLPSKKQIELSTSFFFQAPQADQGLFVFLRDRTEKHTLQQKLYHKDRLEKLGEASMIIAHELRNPLGGVRGYASLLYRDLASQPSLQEMAGLILEGVKSFERNLQAILQYARPLDLSLKSLEIGVFLKQLKRFVQIDPAFPANVRWEMHIPETPLLAPIDPDALRLALLNLFLNAFQAMPEGGLLRVCLIQMESFYQIDISDTGIGMDEEQLKGLFSLFRTTKKQGTGVGLVETQKIIQAHKGTIAVRSQPHQGTTFTLTLPLRR